MERLKQLKLSTMKYKCLWGDMLEVYKIVHNYYDSKTAVKMNFNSFQTTRGNNYKLQKFVCHYYNLIKYSCWSRVVNVWNSLPDYVVEADTINILRIDWINIGLFKRIYLTLTLT